MRNRASRFAIIIIVLLALGNISMHEVKHNRHIQADNFQDSTPPPKEVKPPKIPKKLPDIKLPEIKLPKAPKPKNLFKRLADVLKFQKYSQENERKRVTVFVNQLIADSIEASEQNVKFLITQLADTVNQNIDSLRALINFIRNSEQDLYSMQQDISSSQDDIETKLRRLDEYMNISRDKYASREVSDRALNILASKIFPIIEVSIDVKALALRATRLKMQHDVRDSVQVVRYLNPDTSYTVGLKNRIGVYGFYNYFTRSAFRVDKLGYLNTFIYNTVFINSQTGDAQYLNGWDTSSVVTYAQKALCNVSVSFSIQGQDPTRIFLNNYISQARFNKTAIYLMKSRNATGINIAFNAIPDGSGENFNYFIRNLYRDLKQKDPRFTLLVTVPAITTGNNYSLDVLKDISDHIIIDFSKNYATIASPLASITEMDNVAAYFLKAKVAPAKIVINLPYQGTKWAINTGYEDKFIEYISYAGIRRNYPFAGYNNNLDSNTVSQTMDSFNRWKVPVRRIFYDDESTLSRKYEWALENEMGGVAISSLGDDYNYSGLWDELALAFIVPDTSYLIKNSTARAGAGDLTFFDKLFRKLALYSYILQNPCEKCFGNILDTTERDRYKQYLADLDISGDSGKRALANIERIKDHQNPYESDFDYINYELTTRLLIITVLIFIILGLLFALYMYRLNKMAELWTWKRKMQYILIGVSVLSILFLFTTLFSSDNVPIFGASGAHNGESPKVYVTAVNANSDADREEAAYCLPEPGADCVNMPLSTLLLIICVVLVIGYLLTKYLVFPMMKKENP